MLTLARPRPLAPGSRVALVSPSWGGPGSFPHRYEMGVGELRERFGLEIVEMPHVRADAEWVWRHPEARADDLNAAFADASIDAVFTTIGGDDSVRVLPHLDAGVLAANPKAFLGFSDTTTLHVFALINGVQTFYGPSVMAGIAENGGTLPFTEHWFRRAVMSGEPIGDLPVAEEWTEEHVEWAEIERAGDRRSMQPNPGWRWLGGDRRAEGHLVGGCLDVLEFLKQTPWWPSMDIWDGAIFYWETSEEAPPPSLVKYWLRNYGMQGILDRLAGMLVGRPRSYTAEQRAELATVIADVVAVEFGRPDLPIVLDLDFGHTDPQLTIPNGATAVIDPQTRRVSIPQR